MAKFEIDGDSVPSGYEAIAFRTPQRGDCFITDAGQLHEACDDDLYPPRLIVRKKEVAKKARPYNADEMLAMYLARKRFVVGDVCVDAIGYDRHGNLILVGEEWLTAADLQSGYTHLDGTRCEVIE